MAGIDPLDRFERKYVINLPQREDRRRETRAELARIACEGVAFHPATRPADPNGFGSVGEHGCYLSHLAAWKRACGARSVLVMEDDIQFAHDYADRARIIDRLPDDWDVLYIGHMQLPGLKRAPAGEGVASIDPDIEFIGLHCYAINGRAVPRIIAAAEAFLSREHGHPDGGKMPIDGALNVARRQLGLKTYAVVPPLAYQRASKTDIASHRWFDRIPALAGAISALRRLKNKVSRR